MIFSTQIPLPIDCIMLGRNPKSLDFKRFEIIYSLHGHVVDPRICLHPLNTLVWLRGVHSCFKSRLCRDKGARLRFLRANLYLASETSGPEP
jgi:hypothetical protein